MRGPDGQSWWTTAEAAERLGVKGSRLRDWVRRAKAAGHVAGAGPEDCPACGPERFPHVDPPKRCGSVGLYVAEQLMAAEVHTDGSHRGAARHA